MAYRSAFPVLRDYCPNSSITPLITARSLQDRTNVLHKGPHSQRVGHHAAEAKTIRRRIGFRGKKCHHALFAESSGAKIGNNGAVNTSRDAHNSALALELVEDQLANAPNNPVALPLGIQLQNVGRNV
jgi:hypothetical protein